MASAAPSANILGAMFAAGSTFAGIAGLYVSVFLLGNFDPGIGPVGVFILMSGSAAVTGLISGYLFALVGARGSSPLGGRSMRSWAFICGIGHMLAGAALYLGAPDVGEPLPVRAAIVWGLIAVVAAVAYRRNFSSSAHAEET